MIRAVVQFEREPEAERYQRHVDEFVSKVPCTAFRHGRAIGSPVRRAAVRVLRGVRVGRRDAFKAATQTEEFAVTGKDAMEMGIPFTVAFVEIE